MSSKFISALDTARFGFPIAKIDVFDNNLTSDLQALREEGCRLVMSKVSLHDLEQVHRLEALGFRLMDTQSTYHFDLSRISDGQLSVLSPDVVIAPFSAHQMASIIALGEESFQGYGHYFADAKLNRKSCLAVYSDWAARSCDNLKVADIMFVAEIDGIVAGFLSFKKFESSSGNYATGGIGAVSSNFRGRDVFKMLTVSGLQWGAAQGLMWEEHNVLSTNYPVNKSFSSLGFRITHAFSTFHLWL